MQFTHARVNDALSLSELAVEVLLPSDHDIPEDVAEHEEEIDEIKKNSDQMQPKAYIERFVALSKRIQRRGTKKLMSLKPVQFTYESVSCFFYQLGCFIVFE